ncbi:hypothetical protein [uncultured Thiothrix sp.]|uniref:hypothetical protein n=1 Tax=uncultured Thiothrix sp. TaxID=223185 RepID=UPI00261192CB|nr:hypothetical protein [uncultured Thiothrix sp.]
MSEELQLLQNVVRLGCDIVIDGRKWSIESLQLLVPHAKQSGAKITLRYATALLRGIGKTKVELLASIGKSVLIFDFSE